MGFFSGKSRKNRFVSNVTLKQLDLFEQLERTVVLAVKGGSPLIDGALHMCVTQAGYEKAAAARGAMPQERARELMGPKTVFLLGELPRTGEKGERFGFATIKREGGYESVKCFLTPESAQKFNAEGYPVTPVRVGDLERFVAGTFALIIEPHRNYWLELGAESAKCSGGD